MSRLGEFRIKLLVIAPSASTFPIMVYAVNPSFNNSPQPWLRMWNFDYHAIDTLID